MLSTIDINDLITIIWEINFTELKTMLELRDFVNWSSTAMFVLTIEEDVSFFSEDHSLKFATRNFLIVLAIFRSLHKTEFFLFLFVTLDSVTETLDAFIFTNKAAMLCFAE